MNKLLIFILVIGLTNAEKKCQKGWFKVKGHCYHVGEEFLSSLESEKYCKNLDSRMAKFEQNKIPQRLKFELKGKHLDSCGYDICGWWVAPQKNKNGNKWLDSCVELLHIKGKIFKFNHVYCFAELKPICQKKLL